MQKLKFRSTSNCMGIVAKYSFPPWQTTQVSTKSKIGKSYWIILFCIYFLSIYLYCVNISRLSLLTVKYQRKIIHDIFKKSKCGVFCQFFSMQIRYPNLAVEFRRYIRACKHKKTNVMKNKDFHFHV